MADARALLQRIVNCWSEFGKLPDRDALWKALEDADAYLAAPVPAPPAEPLAADEGLQRIEVFIHRANTVFPETPVFDSFGKLARWAQRKIESAAPAEAPPTQDDDLVAPSPTQRMIDAGYKRRPSHRALPDDTPAEPVAQQPPPLKAAIERYWNMLGKVADEGKCGSECHDALRALIAASKAESAAQQPEAPVAPAACAVCGCDMFVTRCLHCNAIPAAAPEAPQGDDAEVGGTCNVCGNGVRYGSRHHRCGAAIESALAAYRERERAAYERAALLCDAVAIRLHGGRKRINQVDAHVAQVMRDMAASIRSLATPDSAASPTGERDERQADSSPS